MRTDFQVKRRSKASTKVTARTLKWIAILSMMTDHFACVFLQEETKLYVFLRLLGRIAFPIYAFLLTEGFLHTTNVKKYLQRLFFFALLSEIPFDLAFYGTPFYPERQNVFFTLGIGLLGMFLLKKTHELQEKGDFTATFLKFFLISGSCCIAAYLLHADYGAIGVLSILMLYLFRTRLQLKNKPAYLMECGILCMISLSEAFAMIMTPILEAYDGTPGSRKHKRFFYWFYPVHLFLYWGILMGIKAFL